MRQANHGPVMLGVYGHPTADQTDRLPATIEEDQEPERWDGMS